MSSTSSSTSFFSFGPDDSFISKSFEGLRYRNLPPALNQLIGKGSVIDVHWAALGPVQESWVLSFQDVSGKSNLGWGTDTPPSLTRILKALTPSQHLRVFLGPSTQHTYKDPSFIAWDPTFIRWHNLPSPLETCIQSWLTPSGWKSGAPKVMTWNAKGSCFAVSEYDDVIIRMGEKEIDDDDDTPFVDTVKEWSEEEGFKWKDVAYLNLDPRDSDQFIAIRHDGTWAGSIDSDANEEALEAFALNLLAPLKPAKPMNPSTQTRPKAKSQPDPRPTPPPQQNNNRSQNNTYNNNRSNQHNPNNPNYRNGQKNSTNNGYPPPKQIPISMPSIPDATSQAQYNRWANETATMLASALAANNAPSPSPTPSGTSRSRSRPPKKIQVRSSSSSIPTTGVSGKLLTSFPYLPPSLTICVVPVCMQYKKDASGLRACKHDVERLLRASGLYSKEWLKQERIRWHPDRFGRLCEVGFRNEGRRLSEEMFKVVDALLIEEGERGG